MDTGLFGQSPRQVPRRALRPDWVTDVIRLDSRSDHKAPGSPKSLGLCSTCDACPDGPSETDGDSVCSEKHVSTHRILMICLAQKRDQA